ncbi:RNA polymerase sigma factor [Psychrosphaera sp. 1_MG-2023]|uniref:RNA polymerase sigma factor n=1 Tax=Psychrosphaera sp. 1_MG-2023 TaxID=3062643 RepID=UPI0026E3F9B9|nr:RNA polymerase sigma factor [Psychrosphaera sp. 1_MG-2023]MDO6718143.1 RNA polymerase sigma factor [Psychrosphaera sp. 1_MG-2023]
MVGNVISPQQFQQVDVNRVDDDAQLVVLLKQGNQNALKQLYDKYINRTYALSLRLSGDREIAEDITQEVYVQVWQKIHNFRGDSKFSTWLQSVTSNVAISHMRKQKPWWRSWFGSDEKNQQALDAQEISDDYSDYDLSRSGLDKHIASLPEQARVVFVLFAIEGWRHEEISKELGIAVGSSKAQYHRAKQLLQKQLLAEDEQSQTRGGH